MTFVSHTIDTAPEKARPIIEATTRGFGYLPEPVARMAESPELLSTFLGNVAVFDRSTLTEVERETVIMTMATRVECHYCVAMHTPKLPDEIAGPLRSGKPLDDSRLEALRQFTTAVLATSGGVSEEDLRAFLAAGFTHRNALDVVLGVGTYTLSTFANRLTAAPLDAEFEPYRWDSHHTGRSATG
ncbi:carboxymuconolactone decarboxylase family protein [Actinokineospora sp.]|uniref:carboxymuconolactone decarboxylase family protein n=1 Tax=Actinokineospora sp. TaxID=1872133 RepID=UPI003D6C4891